MKIQQGIWGLGLAILCAALSGCVVPCGYYGSCGPCAAPLAASCTSCEAEPGMACDGAACGPACGCGILRCLESLFTCGTGCGRMYWGEWAYDPPVRRDPCNDYGEWEGPSCGPACGLFGGCGLFWSARFHGSCGLPSCGCAGGCDECAGGCDDCACACGNGYGDEVFPGNALDPEWGQPTEESLEDVLEMPSVLQSEPTLGARKPAAAGKTANTRKPVSGRDSDSRLARQSRTRVVR